MTFPDMTFPDMTFPDLTSPDLTSPDITSPDMTSPDLTIARSSRPTSLGGMLKLYLMSEPDLFAALQVDKRLQSEGSPTRGFH
ncbi:MAG: hypothetical protein ACREDR_30195, partial [Blastocatellia bacterium]